MTLQFLLLILNQFIFYNFLKQNLIQTCLTNKSLKQMHQNIQDNMRLLMKQKRRLLREGLLDVLFLSMLVIAVQNLCIYSSKCDVKCKDQICEDPSTNSYYNSSVSSSSPGYHGMGCCLGCNPQYPYGIEYYYNQVAKTCSKGSCTKDQNGVQQYWYKDNTCRYDCTTNGLWVMNPYYGTCEYTCSWGYWELNDTRLCVSQCSIELYKYVSSMYDYGINIYVRRCVPSCNGMYTNKNTMSCESKCTTGYSNNETMQCDTICPPGKYGDTIKHICIWKELCWTTYKQYADDFTGACEFICSNDYQGYSDTFSCVSSCPEGTYKSTEQRQIQYSIKIGKICINKTKCSSLSPKMFINNNTLSCEQNCSDGLYADYLSGYCVVSCPANTYKYQNMKICIENCTSFSGGYLKPNPTTNSCEPHSYQNYSNYSPYSPYTPNTPISPNQPNNPNQPGSSNTPSSSNTPGSSNNYHIIINQAAAIIICVVVLVALAAFIACQIYIIRKMRMRKRYTEIPMNLTSERIDIQYGR